MAIRTKKYISKGGRVIKGVKVNEKNIVDVANWAAKVKSGVARVKISKSGDESNHRVAVGTPRGIRVAHVGDFVVFDEETFTINVVKGDLFVTKYKVV